MKYLFEIILFVLALLAVFACVRSWLHRYDIPPKKLAPRRAVPIWMPQRLAGILCLLFILACAPPGAMAQVTPSTPILLTNIPTGFVGASGTNLFTGCTNSLGTPSNNVIQLWQGNGLAFVQKFLTTNASAQIGTATTNSVTMQWALSFDGTNFLTNPESLLNITNYGVSSNIACGGSNITSAFLNNFAYVAPYTISNNMTGATNDITNYQAWAVHGAPFNGGFP